MKAAPQVGQTYRQEFARGVAEDNGEVLSRTDTAVVPIGSFTDVLKTRDTNALEPGQVEEKFYAAVSASCSPS